jgi:hypothetical protein
MDVRAKQLLSYQRALVNSELRGFGFAPRHLKRSASKRSMSYDIFVYLIRHDMPNPTDWRDAIVSAGFPVALYTDFDVDSFTGFLPCPVNGKISGFEYYVSNIDPQHAARLQLARGTDFAVQFSIGARPLEVVSALAASSVLAALSSGTLNDPQTGETVLGNAAVDWAKSELAKGPTNWSGCST